MNVLKTINTRRQFLKNTGLGTTALFTSSFVSVPNLLQINEKKLGVALVGLGIYLLQTKNTKNRSHENHGKTWKL